MVRTGRSPHSSAYPDYFGRCADAGRSDVAREGTCSRRGGQTNPKVARRYHSVGRADLHANGEIPVVEGDLETSWSGERENCREIATGDLDRLTGRGPVSRRGEGRWRTAQDQRGQCRHCALHGKFAGRSPGAGHRYFAAQSSDCGRTTDANHDLLVESAA